MPDMYRYNIEASIDPGRSRFVLGIGVFLSGHDQVQVQVWSAHLLLPSRSGWSASTHCFGSTFEMLRPCVLCPRTNLK